jgi:hypothetical protein
LWIPIVTIETIHFRNTAEDINMATLLTVKGMLMSHVQLVDALPEWRESAPYWAKHHQLHGNGPWKINYVNPADPRKPKQ